MYSRIKRLIYHITHPFIRFFWKIYKPKTAGARALIIHDDTSILLIKNIGASHWSLPGGKIEKGEHPEECVLREIAEELSITDLAIRYKLGTYTASGEGKHDMVHIFVAHTNTYAFKKQWELDTAAWWPITQLPEKLSPATKRRINEYQKGCQYIKGVW